MGSVLTVEQQAPSGHAPPSPVLRHALVHAGVLRPEVRDLQDAAAGVVDLHLACQRLSVRSSPPDGGHGAARGLDTQEASVTPPADATYS